MTWIWTTDGTANNSVNLSPATGARAVWSWASVLMQAGWTKPADSDGTTYSSSGAQVTSGASGAGGLGNTSAWIRLQSPDGVREICMQRGTTNLLWRAKWSHSAKFTGGSPGATQTASATDEQIINAVGGGTNAAPTYTTIFGADASFKFHVGADNAAPYSWWWHAMTSGGSTNLKRGWYINMAAGSYPVEDVAPYLVDFGGTATPYSSAGIWGSSYYKKGLAGEAWVPFYTLIYYSNRQAAQQIPGGSGQVLNPYTGYEDTLPTGIGRDPGLSTQIGWKGFLDTALNRWTFRNQSSGAALDSVDSTARWMSIGGGGAVWRWPPGVALSTVF